MKFHPLCKQLPEMSEEEFQALTEDIKKHGLREPILLYDGQIIDGRHRYLACRAAGVKEEYKKYEGANPLALVKSLNVFRRHLNESQRAMIAATLANAVGGGDRAHLHDGSEVTNEEAAKTMKVSARIVKQAKTVQKNASASIKKEVNRGNLSVNAAVKLATLPKDKQEKIAAKGIEKIKEAASDISSPRGGLANEKMNDMKKKKAETDKEKMLEALDAWWEKTKSTMAYSTPSPKMIYDEIRNLIEANL